MVDVIDDLITKYDVDGIHFDDYFYLYTDIGNIDQETFRSRNPRRLSLAQWRRSNVDNVIYGVRQAVDASNRATGRRVAFGVSPFGIWANKSHLASGSLTGGKESYFTQYADSRVSGSVLFSYRSVFLPANAAMKEGVNRALRTYWRAPALRPLYRNLR